MKFIFASVIALSSIFASVSFADDNAYARSVLCQRLATQYGSMMAGESLQEKAILCRPAVRFTTVEDRTYVMLRAGRNLITCKVERSSGRSKIGLSLGACKLTQAHPRIGVTN